MSKNRHQLRKAGSAHIIGAWLFLAASLIAGILGVARLIPTGADCVCLAILFAVIAAVLALLGIHQQNVVLYDEIGPGYQGSHGSPDGGGSSDSGDDGGI
jgi:hypothetical protein